MVKITIYAEICKGCGLCVSACPKKLLNLSSTQLNSKGYQPAQIDDVRKCTGCAACARICPDIAIEIDR